MSAIFGILGVNDTDRTFVNVIGQQVVYEAIVELLRRWNEEVSQMKAVFVERETDAFKLKYKLPGGGRLQRMGRQAPAGAVKLYGEWECALPLDQVGAQFGGDRVDLAYMTVQELDRHLDAVMTQDLNTIRYEILRALLNDVNVAYTDFQHGALTIRRLANTDGTLYPPVIGSETEAQDDHYLVAGYTVTNISDINDPYTTVVNELCEHVGFSQKGDEIVAFVDPVTVVESRVMTGWVDIGDIGVRPGEDTATVIGLPSGLPGRIVGRCNGVWVSEWRWMPTTYLLAIHLGAEAPLLERIDPADTGLATGLQMVSKFEEHPLQSSHFEHRYGFGVGNRLGACVMEISEGADYGIPAGYA